MRLCAFLVFLCFVLAAPVVGFSSTDHSAGKKKDSGEQSLKETHRADHIQTLVDRGRLDLARKELERGLASNPQDQRLLQIEDEIKLKEEEIQAAQKKRAEDESARSRKRVEESKKAQVKNTRLNHIRSMMKRQKYDIAERELAGLLKQFPGDEELLAVQDEIKDHKNN